MHIDDRRASRTVDEGMAAMAVRLSTIMVSCDHGSHMFRVDALRWYSHERRPTLGVPVDHVCVMVVSALLTLGHIMCVSAGQINRLMVGCSHGNA